MIPAEKVVAVCPDDPVRRVMDLMLENKIGSVIVIQKETKKRDHVETLLPMPVGIITKSDIMKAYQNKLGIDAPCREIMTSRDLDTCTPDMTRDQAARLLQRNRHHHIIVIDRQHQHFLGLVSSWDITVECAKDDRAWPWIRSDDGKFHSPKERRSLSPTSAATTNVAAVAEATTTTAATKEEEHKETIFDHQHDEFTTYMDDLDLMCLM